MPLPNPPTKDNLESAHFTSASAAVKTRLTSVLRSDGAHIGKFSPPSEANEVIKDALRKATPGTPGMKPITDPPNVFGDSTAAAVIAYKGVNGIVRAGQQLDNIVGRMTLARLDSEMKNLESAPVVPPAPAEDTRKPIDILIQIHGANPASAVSGKETTDDVFGNIAFVRAQIETDRYKQERELRAISFFGAPTPRDPVAAIAKKVDEVRALSGPGGKTVVTGSSIGGKNAARLAVTLQAKMKLAYVALIDAGFDSARDPDLVAGIRATGDSFFEDMTNSWGDVMGFVEFHGVATGTTSQNVQGMSAGVYFAGAAGITKIRELPNVPGVRKAKVLAAEGLFKKLHDQAVSDGNNRAIAKVAMALTL